MSRTDNSQPVTVQSYKPFVKHAIPAMPAHVAHTIAPQYPQAQTTWNGRIDPIKLAIAKYEREQINKMLGY